MEKNFKVTVFHHDPGLDLTMPNVELIRDFYIYYNLFKWIEPLFFYLSCTHTHTYSQTHTQTQAHTDGHEYSIVAVDKPQL